MPTTDRCRGCDGEQVDPVAGDSALEFCRTAEPGTWRHFMGSRRGIPRPSCRHSSYRARTAAGQPVFPMGGFWPGLTRRGSKARFWIGVGVVTTGGRLSPWSCRRSGSAPCPRCRRATCGSCARAGRRRRARPCTAICPDSFGVCVTDLRHRSFPYGPRSLDQRGKSARVFVHLSEDSLPRSHPDSDIGK